MPAIAITAARNPGGLTGGEEGLSLNRAALPAFLSGVVNAPYRYWLALAFLVVCVLVVAWLTTARTGHAWAAVRECWKLSGDIDFVLKCVAPDLRAFQDFVGELTGLPNVRNVRTALALDRVKDEPIVPFG